MQGMCTQAASPCDKYLDLGGMELPHRRPPGLSQVAQGAPGQGGKNPRPGRVLTAEDIAHYQTISVALNETIRLMKEVDEVIEEHGGWPDAFQVERAREGEAQEEVVGSIAIVM